MFRSFFMAGFECSTHRLKSGKRLDLIHATRHDDFLTQDYQRLKQLNIHTVRSGIRWHLIEPAPGRYDFSSVLPFIKAADTFDMQVIWDLCHYGYPDDIDIFSPNFVRRFRRLVAAFVEVYASETDQPLFVCPVNEISFFAWAGGDGGHLNPYAENRSFELKSQLVRASIEAIEVIRDVLPDARFAAIDPIIHIVPRRDHPEDTATAEGYRLAQYQAWDMLAGRLCPHLGGDEKYLDLIGVNYYFNNQWFYEGETIKRADPEYRPFHTLLEEVYRRYERPLFIAETGIEDDLRPDWLAYMTGEAIRAMENGVPLQGMCLYPILCHPGWDDDRHCHNGLWDYADEHGAREVCAPYARELKRQQGRVAEFLRQEQDKIAAD